MEDDRSSFVVSGSLGLLEKQTAAAQSACDHLATILQRPAPQGTLPALVRLLDPDRLGANNPHSTSPPRSQNGSSPAVSSLGSSDHADRLAAPNGIDAGVSSPSLTKARSSDSHQVRLAC